MRFWALLMGGVFWYLLSDSGYPSLGIIVMVLCTAYALLPGPKETAKEKGKNYEQLEPIVIESKRGAPYRMPKKIELTYKEKDKLDKDWADNVVSGVSSVFDAGVKAVKKMFE